jgi:hypothetical protein
MTMPFTHRRVEDEHLVVRLIQAGPTSYTSVRMRDRGYGASDPIRTLEIGPRLSLHHGPLEGIWEGIAYADEPKVWVAREAHPSLVVAWLRPSRGGAA